MRPSTFFFALLALALATWALARGLAPLSATLDFVRDPPGREKSLRACSREELRDKTPRPDCV